VRLEGLSVRFAMAERELVFSFLGRLERGVIRARADHFRRGGYDFESSLWKPDEMIAANAPVEVEFFKGWRNFLHGSMTLGPAGILNHTLGIEIRNIQIEGDVPRGPVRSANEAETLKVVQEICGASDRPKAVVAAARVRADLRQRGRRPFSAKYLTDAIRAEIAQRVR
jgi:hypothetical protein